MVRGAGVVAAFTFHREPLAHQRRDFERFKDAPIVPLFYEPRCGKTKVINDIFRYRAWVRCDVDCMVVLSDPNGVHHVFIDELEKDFSPEERAALKTLSWRAGYTAERVAAKAEALALRAHPGPIIATFYCGTLTTETGWKYINWLLARRRVLLAADESAWAANSNARTKRLLALGGYYRRRPQGVPALAFDPRNVVVKAILDGTPVDEGPDDVFYPTQFLRRGLLGFDDPVSFRARYTQYETEEVEEERNGRMVIVERDVVRQNFRQGKMVKGVFQPQEFKVKVGYKNLPELKAKLATIGSRVERADISDAPPITYASAYFELTPKQRRVYDRLRNEYVAELAGAEYTVRNVLLRKTRLQQVARNYYPPEQHSDPCRCLGQDPICEDCEGLGVLITKNGLEIIDPDHNPALDALRAQLRTLRGPVVVGARFRQDVTDVIAAGAEMGKTILRYDGLIPEREREANYQAFRAGEGDGIAGTITSGLGKGKDLSRAVGVVFYSNWFGLRARRQFEARAENAARTFSTAVIDLVAANTRDIEAVEALRAKRSVAEMIMGDKVSNWL